MRRAGLVFALHLSLGSLGFPALAQPLARATDAAAERAPEPPPKGPLVPVAPEPSASDSAPRPVSGPGVRERSSRGRRANPAGGVLFIAIIVGAIGYYVVKKFRR